MDGHPLDASLAPASPPAVRAGRRRLVAGAAAALAAAGALAAACLRVARVEAGGMAPFVAGPWLEVQCVVCRRRHVRHLGPGELPGVLVHDGCLHCRAPAVVAVREARPGQLVLHEAPWLAGAPARWDAVVVEPPGGGRAVLRVVGLAGEAVEVRGGDLVIDGALADRPRRHARRPWRLEYHSRPGPAGWIAPWLPVGPGAPGGWDLRLMTRPTWNGVGPGASPWLRYLDRLDDVEPQDGPLPAEPAGDLSLTLTVARCDGEVQLAVERDGRVVAACVPLAGAEGTVRLEVDGRVVATRFGAVPETPCDVRLDHFDRRARVWLGKEQVLEWADPLPPAPLRRASVQLRAVGPSLIAEGFVVHRQQGWRGGGRFDPARGPVRVPAGHVFLLGDDPLRATDSRHFGPVPLERLRGRVLWPR